MENEKYEIVKFVDNEFELDVNVDFKEESIWLSQQQIAILYGKTKQNVSLHIRNIFKDFELDEKSVVKKNLTTAADGKQYEIMFYNLDVILSVGYRIKSKRGILFRRWANQVLKQYLLNSYVVNDKKCKLCTDNLLELNNKVNFLMKDNDILHSEIDTITSIEKLFYEKLFYENQIFDGYSFIKQLLLSAKEEIIIIDGYVDISVLDMLNDVTIPITIYTLPSAYITNQDITKFQISHILNVIRDDKYHDRFLIIDNEVYSLGSSIKDIGKKRSIMMKLSSITKEMIIK